MSPKETVLNEDQMAQFAEWNRLGHRFHEEHRFDRSLEQFWLSLVRARELKERRWECVALNNIGMVYQSWGKFDHAMKFYSQSLEISRELGYPEGSAAALNNLGRLYEAWGRLDRALEHYKQGLDLALQGDPQTLRVLRLNIAMCLEKLGDFEGCRAQLREVVHLDQVLGHPQAELDRAYLAQMEGRP
ncbi:MAG: tetratricopeptide repeat protein [Thermodesulfobacteriota bacterium]